MNEKKSSKGNRIGLIIAIAILLLSIIGNGIFFSKNNGLKKEKNKALLSKDSLFSVKLLVDKELDKATANLKECEGRNAQLDASLSDLNIQIKEKTIQVEKLLKDNANLNALRTKLKEAQKLREDCEKLAADYAKEIAKLKDDNNTLRQSVNKLSQENEDIKKKLELAKQLKAYDVAIINFKVTKSKQKQTIKAKRTNRISTSFSLAENKVADAGSKKIYIVIYDTKKNIISSNNEKFTNYANGSEMKYSTLKAVDYKNDEQKLTINFDTDNKLVKGKYKVEIYVDGILGGKKEFELK